MDKDTTETNGWRCPGCKKVWAPSVKSCLDCEKLESAQPKDTRKFLTEKGSGFDINAFKNGALYYD